MSGPDAPPIEHAVGVVLVGNGVVVKGTIPDVRAGRALDKVQWVTWHGPSILGGGWPAQGGEGLLPTIEEWCGDGMGADRARGGNK